MGVSDHLTCLLRNLYANQEAMVKNGQGTTHGSKFGKKYNKAVYCHPACLTYMQNVCVCVSHSVMSDSLRPHGLWFARLLCPWNSPGKNTGVGCHLLLQGIFLPRDHGDYC